YLEEQRNAWYDVIVKDLSLLQRQSLAREFGRAVMDRSIRGVHRVIFNIMATPERFVKNAQAMWDVHHDTGRLRMKLLSRSSIEAAVLDWPSHHDLACMINHYACAVTLEAMGCAGLRERHVCASRGGAECVGSYFWRA